MNTFNKIQKIIWLALICLLPDSKIFGAISSATIQDEKGIGNPDILLRWILAGVIALFVLILIVLSKAINVAGKDYQKKISKIKNKKSLPLLILLMMLNSSVFAAEQSLPISSFSFEQWDVYLMLGVILLLFIALLVIVKSLFVLMGIKSQEKASIDHGRKMRTFFQKINETVPLEEEESLDLSHDYDGIRELDNKVPSWWSWTFFASMIFGVVYLYRMFGSESLPDQYTELKLANEIAAEAKLEYLKKGANNVDENSVVLLGEAEIALGSQLYSKNCIACHGDKGQGNTVGPNLTDNYWIHNGGLRDIFYSIKYGWADKGMKSWKEDFSPGQIAQLASFVHSIQGSNPPNPKDKQGELYIGTADSTGQAAVDSTIKNK